MFRLSSRFSPYQNLTSYDFLKFFAVVTMVIDHIGFFFFPDLDWLRVIGRMSFPVWMFLIGYARTRDIPKSMWIGCALLLGSNIVMGEYIFPLNILALMIVMRFSLDALSRVVFKSKEGLFYSFLVFCILGFPLYMVIEYSTFGVLIVLLGYAVRHRGETCLGTWAEKIYFGAVMSVVAFSQIFIFHFLDSLAYAAFVGFMAVGVMLYHFRPQEYPVLTKKMPIVFRWVLQFCGRYSLEIYVVHVIAFAALAMAIGNDEVEWFSPDLFFH